MRILVWLSLGFASACALGTYVLPASWLLYSGIILTAAAAVCLLLRKKGRAAKLASLLLLGAAAGILWYRLYDGLYLAPARAYQETQQSLEITATEYSRPTDYGGAVDGEVVLNGRKYKIRLYLEESGTVEPGDTLRGTFRLKFTSPKEGEKTSYLQGDGIFLLAYQKGELDIISPEKRSPAAIPALLGKEIRRLLESIFPEDVHPFALALLLGDDSLLTYRQNSDFSITGIRHIIAVSGLHIMLLYNVVSALTFHRRFLTFLLGIPVLVVFAAVAGFTPSVNRACLMALMMMVAQLYQKEYDPPTGLAFSAIVMLAINPLAITSVSFQLSASSVAGIQLFQKPLEKWLLSKVPEALGQKNPLIRGTASSITMTLSAMVMTVPLTAAYFGTVSIVGVLANLLTLWVTNFVFVGIILACLAGAVSAALGSLLGWLLAWPIRYILGLSSLLAKLPLAAVYTASPYVTIWLTLCYALIVGCAVEILMLQRKGSMPAALCSAGLFLCITLGCSWAEPVLDGSRLTILDVGQGQCILLQSQGKNFLIDCGGDTEEKAADAAFHLLYSQGIRRLDAFLLTHGDDDHAGGLEELATRVEISSLFLSATDAKASVPEDIPQVIWVDRETELLFGNTKITIYPPAWSLSDNENSLCILMETPDFTALVTGDRSEKGERQLLQSYDIPEVDLLVAGHHGSNNSTGTVLLKVTKPETVAVSVSRHNTYGHPGWELLQRLANLGCDLYRTDLHGTIVYR